MHLKYVQQAFSDIFINTTSRDSINVKLYLLSQNICDEYLYVAILLSDLPISTNVLAINF